MVAKKTKVLFVCLGNICRSPMAEAAFRHLVHSKGLEGEFFIDSAGTAAYHVGDEPDDRTISTLKKRSITTQHRGQQLKPKHFEEYDYILCMDDSNISNAQRIAPKTGKAKLQLFGVYDEQGERIIEDPYYGGMEGFEHNYEQVVRCSLGFLKTLGY